MSQIHELELRGCTPEPLMSYLKALGIFRLVAEQKDKNVRAWWRNDSFYLRSTLDCEELMAFFLDEYRPSPIVSPWNGGSGFYPSDNSKAMDMILELEAPRFQLWSESIGIGKHIVHQAERIHGSKKAEMKAWILAQCRSQFPDDALNWLDASYVLTSDSAKLPPLLGTGGNDGRLDFSNNFMQNVVSALNLDERRNGEAIARERLIATLFNEGAPRMVKGKSTGFYNPSSVKAANADVGFQGDRLTNPWDYVLMLEGVLMFAGAATRRLSAQATSKAAFPFTVENSAASYGTSVDLEYWKAASKRDVREKLPRGEFWSPIWDQPANLSELTHLVSEGRVQLGKRQVSSGTDFARAIAGLGAERNISQFQRYGFMARNGKAYIAASLGRFHIPTHDKDVSERANVLFDLDAWMERLRNAASDDRMPHGLGTALRRIDDAIIEFCQRGQPRDLQNVLIAVGYAERWLSKSNIRKDTDRGRGVQPLDLSWQWSQYAKDNSAEFWLARAFASILPGIDDRRIEVVGAVRENLEPVTTAQRRTEWDDTNRSFVWTAGDPLSNMLAVLTRRCLDGRVNGLHYPPLESQYSARLDDIVAFLNGDVDYQRIVDLALPLSFISYRQPQSASEFRKYAPFDLPTAYAVIKLTLLPRCKFVCPEFQADTQIRMEPSIPALLRAGRVRDAYDRAHRRLWASGLRPLTDNPGMSDGSDQVRRMAAALLFPLDEAANKALAQRALRQPEPGSD